MPKKAGSESENDNSVPARKNIKTSNRFKAMEVDDEEDDEDDQMLEAVFIGQV